ncbi:MAG: hypothetical protein IJK84_03460 [Bacteroidales bacterium]|nr:hypothetical protein [Bacteroidales bacterium]
MKKAFVTILILAVTIPLVSAQSSFKFAVPNGRLKYQGEGTVTFESIGTRILYTWINKAYWKVVDEVQKENTNDGGYQWWTLIYPSYQFGANQSFYWNANPKLKEFGYYGNPVDLNYAQPFQWRNPFDNDWVSPHVQSIGYELSLDIKRILPMSLFVSMDLERRGINIMDFDIPLTGVHRVSSIIPSVGVRWKLLGNRFGAMHNWNIVLEGMLSDVHNIKYKNAYGLYDVEATNSGIRYTLGVGYAKFDSKTLSASLFLRYAWDTFTFFNPDYTAPDGTQPFAGFSNTWGSVTIGYQFGL